MMHFIAVKFYQSLFYKIFKNVYKDVILKKKIIQNYTVVWGTEILQFKIIVTK